MRFRSDRAPQRLNRSAPTALGSLGLVAGAPAILGAVLGATVNNAGLSSFLLGIGVGAIAQVAPSMRDRDSGSVSPMAIGGLAAGVLVMYLTGLLVTA